MCVPFSSLGQTGTLNSRANYWWCLQFLLNWTLWKEMKTALYQALQCKISLECFSISLSLQVPLPLAVPPVSPPAHHILHSHSSCLGFPPLQHSPKHADFVQQNPQTRALLDKPQPPVDCTRVSQFSCGHILWHTPVGKDDSKFNNYLSSQEREKKKNLANPSSGPPHTDWRPPPQSGLLGHHQLSKAYPKNSGTRVPGWPWWHPGPFNM